MTDCLFCRIARGELGTRFVAENDGAVAFLDLHPRSPGHTIVIPRTHAPSLPELPAEAVAPVFALAREVAQLLGRTFGTKGMSIGINQGAEAEQEVAHLHVHLMPRFAGDGGRAVQSLVHLEPTPAQQELITTLTHDRSTNP